MFPEENQAPLRFVTWQKSCFWFGKNWIMTTKQNYKIKSFNTGGII